MSEGRAELPGKGEERAEFLTQRKMKLAIIELYEKLQEIKDDILDSDMSIEEALVDKSEIFDILDKTIPVIISLLKRSYPPERSYPPADYFDSKNNIFEEYASDDNRIDNYQDPLFDFKDSLEVDLEKDIEKSLISEEQVDIEQEVFTTKELFNFSKQAISKALKIIKAITSSKDKMYIDLYVGINQCDKILSVLGDHQLKFISKPKEFIVPDISDSQNEPEKLEFKPMQLKFEKEEIKYQPQSFLLRQTLRESKLKSELKSRINQHIDTLITSIDFYCGQVFALESQKKCGEFAKKIFRSYRNPSEKNDITTLETMYENIREVSDNFLYVNKLTNVILLASSDEKIIIDGQELTKEGITKYIESIYTDIPKAFNKARANTYLLEVINQLSPIVQGFKNKSQEETKSTIIKGEIENINRLIDQTITQVDSYCDATFALESQKQCGQFAKRIFSSYKNPSEKNDITTLETMYENIRGVSNNFSYVNKLTNVILLASSDEKIIVDGQPFTKEEIEKYLELIYINIPIAFKENRGRTNLLNVINQLSPIVQSINKKSEEAIAILAIVNTLSDNPQEEIKETKKTVEAQIKANDLFITPSMDNFVHFMDSIYQSIDADPEQWTHLGKLNAQLDSVCSTVDTAINSKCSNDEINAIAMKASIDTYNFIQASSPQNEAKLQVIMADFIKDTSAQFIKYVHNAMSDIATKIRDNKLNIPVEIKFDNIEYQPKEAIGANTVAYNSLLAERRRSCLSHIQQVNVQIDTLMAGRNTISQSISSAELKIAAVMTKIRENKISSEAGLKSSADIGEKLQKISARINNTIDSAILTESNDELRQCISAIEKLNHSIDTTIKNAKIDIRKLFDDLAKESFDIVMRENQEQKSTGKSTTTSDIYSRLDPFWAMQSTITKLKKQVQYRPENCAQAFVELYQTLELGARSIKGQPLLNLLKSADGAYQERYDQLSQKSKPPSAPTPKLTSVAEKKAEKKAEKPVVRDSGSGTPPRRQKSH